MKKFQPSVIALASLLLGTATAAQAEKTEAPNYGDAPRGCYQLLAHGDEVFVAFAGTLEDQMATPVRHQAGTTAGAVFVFDAEKLQLRQEIALEDSSGALVLNPAQNQLVVGHTYNHAISTIDLATRKALYHVLDLDHDGTPYRLRYLAADAGGSIFASAFAIEDEPHSAIFKFNANGQRMPGYAVQPFKGFALPVFVTNRWSEDGHEQVLAGSDTLRLYNARTGEAEYVSPQPVSSGTAAATNFYTYSHGPGKSILAANHYSWLNGSQGEYNLYLLEKGKEDQPQKIFTANTALETLYNVATGQIYATSYGPYFDGRGGQVLSIMASDGSVPLDEARFENIRFGEGLIPNSIAMRSTSEGTDLFVSLRGAAMQLAKVRISAGVKGVTDIRKAGACSVTVWDFAQRNTSAPQPCDFVDVEQQFSANLAAAKAYAESAPQQLEDARKAVTDAQLALQQARAKLAADVDNQELQKQEQLARNMLTMLVMMQQNHEKSAAIAAEVVNGATRHLDGVRKKQ